MKRWARRHKLPAPLAVGYEAFIRFYRLSWGRRFLRLFFRKKVPRQVVFVIGCYNSGTTVVKQAIGLHPDIAMAPIEGDRLTNELEPFEQWGFPRCMYANAYDIFCELSDGEISSESVISDLRPWMKEGKIFLEKSISNTCRIPLLRKAFPGTKFVCIVRKVDGVVDGILRRSKPQGLATRLLEANEYPEDMLRRQWAFFYDMALKGDDGSSNDVCYCSYENFLSDPAGELKEIYSFLELRGHDIEIEGNILNVAGETLLVRPPKVPSEERSTLDKPDHLRSEIGLVLSVS